MVSRTRERGRWGIRQSIVASCAICLSCSEEGSAVRDGMDRASDKCRPELASQQHVLIRQVPLLATGLQAYPASVRGSVPPHISAGEWPKSAQRPGAQRPSSPHTVDIRPVPLSSAPPTTSSLGPWTRLGVAGGSVLRHDCMTGMTVTRCLGWRWSLVVVVGAVGTHGWAVVHARVRGMAGAPGATSGKIKSGTVIVGSLERWSA